MSIVQEYNKGNKEISVALCTYNGDKYLEDQLQSIAEQSLLPAEMVICDDHSSDGTVEIIKRFQQEVNFPVRLFENKERLGVVRNFSRAISLCEAGYVATCDQDDIWLSERLAKSNLAMKNAESKYGENIPLLVHSDLKLANAEGKIIAPSFIKRAGIKVVKDEPLKNLLVQNFVTGSTILVNRALLDMVLPIPIDAVMHDRWLALGAAALGKIITIAEPTVIYRQHDQNLIGSKTVISSHTLKRILNIKALEKDLAAIIQQNLIFKGLINEKHGLSLPEYMCIFLDQAQKNGPAAAVTALRFKIRKNPWYMNLIFILLLFKGGYIDHINKDFKASEK